MEVLKVTTVEEIVSILLPQTPEKARELVRWSFYKRPPRMPSWFLWDFIEDTSTVICNVPEFAQTAVSHDLHYIAWDNPPKQHPHILTINDTNEMIASGAAFAIKIKHDDPVLDKIDKDLLCRKNGSFTPG